MDASFPASKASFEDGTYVVRLVHLLGDVFTFLDCCVENACNVIGEISDTLSSIVESAKFDCSLGQLWRADGIVCYLLAAKRRQKHARWLSVLVCLKAD